MQDSDRERDSFRAVLETSARSRGFWSSVAGIVGVIAVVAGGILYPAIEEIDDFGIAVVVIGLTLLLLAVALSPRDVAGFLMGRQGKFGSNVLVMTLAFFAIAVLVNFLFFRNPERYDLTATRVFSLAPRTVQILEELDGPLRANAFFVPTDDNQVLAKDRAEDLLNEFARKSNNFSYRFVDPELKKSIADRYRVTRHPAIVFESVEGGTLQGMVCSQLPNCFNFTEQEFVTAILVTTGEEQKIVYYLTGHDERAVTRDAATGAMDEEGFDLAILGIQRDNYLVRPLNLTQIGGVPTDAALLIIAGPTKDLQDSDTFSESAALAAYITAGGRILALFDPGAPASFVDLISRWGVTLGGDTVADAVSNVAGAQLTPLLQRANAQYNSVSATGIPITDQIDVTFFPAATSVELSKPAADMPFHIAVTSLAQTTPASWLETDVESVSYDAGTEQPGPFSLASVVAAQGTVDEDTPSHPVAKFVIFGDSDFVKSKFFASSDNADLFLNSVNWLAEDFELISIRPRLIPFRELVVNTRERDFIKWSSWFVPPAVMVLLGVFVWWRRR